MKASGRTISSMAWANSLIRTMTTTKESGRTVNQVATGSMYRLLDIDTKVVGLMATIMEKVLKIMITVSILKAIFPKAKRMVSGNSVKLKISFIRVSLKMTNFMERENMFGLGRFTMVNGRNQK
jgi:hypothetical protein